ncbi:hypothetical protein Tdes44962_MAKER06952 [Teratosphaeria destructans]|uniref:Uncharacterized protein n=1 Tax=Teratosphaeria destructans TaxID=418781 RepID=A0A9W7W6Z8_9PEZI|nr:hypothetical protein Tdes44962_MAKER06952 [Teratosphaeria destructans]
MSTQALLHQYRQSLTTHTQTLLHPLLPPPQRPLVIDLLTPDHEQPQPGYFDIAVEPETPAQQYQRRLVAARPRSATWRAVRRNGSTGVVCVGAAGAGGDCGEEGSGGLMGLVVGGG